MIAALGELTHNQSLVKNCEEVINSIITSPNAKIWFEDENGNRFIPTTPITIGHIQLAKLITRYTAEEKE